MDQVFMRMFTVRPGLICMFRAVLCFASWCDITKTDEWKNIWLEHVEVTDRSCHLISHTTVFLNLQLCDGKVAHPFFFFFIRLCLYYCNRRCRVTTPCALVLFWVCQWWMVFVVCLILLLITYTVKRLRKTIHFIIKPFFNCAIQTWG